MKFSANIYRIGINPYVHISLNILNEIFKQADKNKSPIPVTLKIEQENFMQNLVRYQGEWRLYLNTSMRKAAEKDVGDIITIDVEFDGNERIVVMHPKLEVALGKNKKAKKVFDSLPASRQKEILRYINFLKKDESVNRNINRAIRFLCGKERFIGRDNPFKIAG